MKNLLFAATPLKGLFRDLSGSVKVFIREEVELAKTEMSEKMSSYGHNAIGAAVGGFLAYASLIVFLGGVGLLAGFGFQKLNMDPMLAIVFGLGAVGLIGILAGAIMVLKAVKTFSNGSLAPKRTIDTLKHLRRGNGSEQLTRQLEVIQKEKERGLPKRSPDELKAHVLATEDHIEDTLQAIRNWASPARVKQRAEGHLRAHPYKWILGALAGGFVSALFLLERFRVGSSEKTRVRKQEWIAPLKISVRQLR